MGDGPWASLGADEVADWPEIKSRARSRRLAGAWGCAQHLLKAFAATAAAVLGGCASPGPDALGCSVDRYVVGQAVILEVSIHNPFSAPVVLERDATFSVQLSGDDSVSVLGVAAETSAATHQIFVPLIRSDSSVVLKYEIRDYEVVELLLEQRANFKAWLDFKSALGRRRFKCELRNFWRLI